MQRGRFNQTNFLPEMFELYQINVEKNICLQKFNSKKIKLNVMTWYKASVTLTMFACHCLWIGMFFHRTQHILSNVASDGILRLQFERSSLRLL